MRTPDAAGWLTTMEVTAVLVARFGPRGKVTPRAVQAWCHRAVDPLPHVRLGHRVLVHADDLDRWLANGRPAPAPAATRRRLTG